MSLPDEFARFISDQRYSRVPCEFPDKKLYEKYYDAEKIEITLKKGEYLFIPSDWYHFVFSEDTSGSHDVNLAVNFWYVKTRENSEDIQPYTGEHGITIDLDEYANDIVDVSESNCSFFVSNYAHSEKFFNHIDMKCYSSTVSKFLRKRNPYTYIQQNSMKHPVTAPPHKEVPGDHMMTNFWLNFGNVNTQLHSDSYDNILCQVEGSKRVILINPNQRDKLYLYNHYHPDLIKKIELHSITSEINDAYILTAKDIDTGDFILRYTKRLVDTGYLKGRQVRNGNIQILNVYSDTIFLYKNKSDFTFFEIQEGSCEIEFTNRKTCTLEKGSSIIFPDEYYYQYRIKLTSPHVTIKYYPISYYNTHAYNFTFKDVFVKKNTVLEDMPMVVAEANNKLFFFEIFGNAFKYDMLVDSQSKLWCVYIYKGIVSVGDETYSEPGMMLVFPMYLRMNFDGQVMCALVQGPPFK